MAARGGAPLYVLTLGLLAAMALGQHAVPAGEGGQATDLADVVRQWEDYSKGLSGSLTAEQAKNLELANQIKELQAKVAHYESQEKQLEPVQSEEEKRAMTRALDADMLDLEVSELKTKNSDLTKRLAVAEKAAAEAEVYKRKLQDAESALKYAKDALLKAEQDAAGKAGELQKISGSVLPPWAAEKASLLQAKARYHWTMYGYPTLLVAHQRATTGAAAAHKWAAPHVENLHSTVRPHVDRAWTSASAAVQPHLTVLQTRAAEGYSTYLNPHVETTWQAVGPHVMRARAALDPHVAQASAVAQEYHAKVQEQVKTSLETHAGWKGASETLLWYLATSILLLPLLLVVIISGPLLRGSRRVAKDSATIKVATKKNHLKRAKRET